MAASLLTVLKIGKAKAREIPYKLRDGKGLFLEVRPSGKKVWRYRYRLHPGESDQMFTIGDFGDGADEYTLEAARTARDEARKLVKQGVNPRQHRAQARAVAVAEGENTFKAVAEDWFAEGRPHWTPRYASHIRLTLDEDVLPTIGDRPIRSITSADVLAIIKARKEHPTTAILIQQWIGAIFRYAIRHLRADTDPTYAVRGTIKRAPVESRKPIPRTQLAEVNKTLKAEIGSRRMALALRLLMLTFVRPGELRAAKWSEFDLDVSLWRIDASRMKMRRPHVVPLSRQALEVLKELKTLAGSGDYVLPSDRKPRQSINDRTMAQAMERMIPGGYSPHGFRATASTILYEMGYPADVLERQLAHVQKNRTRAAYDHAQFMEQRAAMMQSYADLIDADNVVPLKRVAKKAK
jgi:integrase